MEEYNLIFIVVDSVRSYRTGSDDRDRIDIMDSFAEEATEFTKAFVAAPSSILSASTMFTGLPACFISRHFSDWGFEGKRIVSVQQMLIDKGYALYTILNSREERTILRKMVHPIRSKYLPRGVSQNNWWTNKELTDILKNVLESRERLSPAFYLLWYDCRRDPSTSDEVARGLELFREHGLYDNSIIILCSDHGYPDPATGLTEATMKKFSHDMIITDDNIQVPLLLRYPNGPEGLKVEEEVGTIDLFPTICDILDVPAQNQDFKYKGESLLKIIEDRQRNPRIIRTDTRLNMASGRITCLRSEQYKYVFYWEQKSEELFNLRDDPYEIKNLLGGEQSCQFQTVAQEFRRIKDDMEEEMNRFHIEELRENFSQNVGKQMSKKERQQAKRLLLTTKNAHYVIMKSFLESARENFPRATVDLLVSEKECSEYQDTGFDEIIALKELSTAELADSTVLERSYDVVFYLTEESRQCFIERNMIEIIKMLRKKRSFMLDYNFDIYSRFLSSWYWPIKNFIIRSSNVAFYKDEPSLIFKDIVFLATMFVGRLKKRHNILEGDKVKKMRDRALKAKQRVRKAPAKDCDSGQE